MLKLSGEVKKFTQLLHKKVLKKYSKIDPQIIFISLFGFETTLGDYLRDNLHGNIDRNISILIVPPIDNAYNQIQIKKMETYYNDLMETKRISEHNSQQRNIWADTLSINNSSTLLDVTNSRNKIEELVI